ncbi:SH3 domain-binding glutamic acid-rich-like protein 3 [Strongylocentrotus purpuratus]|uniref:SH3 domain-binding glutamic acid-rich-like protein n=1 Tax=Strongylocentrotus purpuratus TaxID=7668 RepID=A0A7M7TGL2_STRPU|nr:SH3 domain-binding glutamic acid-rich-like protein 3 [Strongylocentrotus purpuratus]|eukprot:XP_787111.1 PREDICTED: SH3 domain-binding glutamic acid-rich-like protein 3 [Strongylocentrotus purpuratus]
MAGVVVYMSTVSSNQAIKKQQQRIKMILDGKKIEYEDVDISQKEEDKVKMREIVGDPKALPPQICNGETYCGDYAAFEIAVEEEDIEGFLKLK